MDARWMRISKLGIPAALAVWLALGGCGGEETRRTGDGGGAATGDGLESDAAGSVRSNAAEQQGTPTNDTLPGRDSRPRQLLRDSGAAQPR